MRLVKLTNKAALGLASLAYKADKLTQRFARIEIECKQKAIIKLQDTIEDVYSDIVTLEQYLPDDTE